MSRRQWLATAGSWAALSSVLRRGDAQVQTGNVTPQGSAKVCIFINLDGGASHLDTFDVKDAGWNPPDADIRQSGPIALNYRFFPRLSAFANELLLIRSAQSWEAAHERGQFYMQTAHPANPAFLAETPHIGAVAALELGGSGKMPPFLALNGSAGQGATFLGGRNEPMTAPANQGGFQTIEHCCFGTNGQRLFDEKYKMLRDFESAAGTPGSAAMAAMGVFYQSAKDLMYDPQISEVFRFSAEEDQRYGNSQFGRACIVARNAVRARAGTSFINIRNGGWDTHQSMFDRSYPQNFYNLVLTLDAGLGPLIDDLKASGHINETLIVIMSEFGRTPGALNTRGGRDHHRNAMSIAMLGGGVKGGRVIGETDAEGDRIIDAGWHMQRPIYVEDVTATLYSALGINWTKRILDTPTGRIFEYVPSSSRGQYVPVREVFG
jgi:hypothetical protein